MGFRELARDHSALVGEHNRLVTAHNFLREESPVTPGIASTPKPAKNNVSVRKVED